MSFENYRAFAFSVALADLEGGNTEGQAHSHKRLR